MNINDDKEYNHLFASCEINWEIENFCFAYPPNEFSILSPEFRLQGLRSVCWRLSLELQDDESPEKTSVKESPQNGLVSVYLEMLPSSLAENVFVSWEMTVTVGSKVFGPYERKVDFADDRKHGNVGFATTKEILDELLLTNYDTIRVRFYFIAFDKDKFAMPKDEKPPGLFHMYKDWKNLKDMEENYSDIKLKVKDKYIKAHKIVLSCNERFDIYIKEAVNDVVEILHFDYKNLDAVVNFLYSREVKYCLADLSTAMMRCLDHFNCEALKTYYIPEELHLNSKIQIKKHEFQWYVPDILDKNDFSFTSPPINFLHSNTIWHITISMRANDPNKFISIFAEITEGEKPKTFSLDFALVNDLGKEFNTLKLVRNNECYENLGFEEFIKKKTITEKRWLIREDCVGFLFRIKTTNGSQESSTGRHGMSFILPSKSKPHKQMIEKMLGFFKTDIYKDITIIAKGGDNNKANKFILAARSPGFKQKIVNEGNTISLWGVERYYLRIILKYMYTGVLEENGEIILELSKLSAPEKLDIPSLHAECEQYMKERNACFIVKKKYPKTENEGF